MENKILIMFPKNFYKNFYTVQLIGLTPQESVGQVLYLLNRYLGATVINGVESSIKQTALVSAFFDQEKIMVGRTDTRQEIVENIRKEKPDITIRLI